MPGNSSRDVLHNVGGAPAAGSHEGPGLNELNRSNELNRREKSSQVATNSTDLGMNEKPLAGKVAVITGASKGLGKAMALALGAAGVRLALASRDAPLLEVVAGEVKTAGTDVLVVQTDVTNEADVARLAAE